MTKNKYRSPFDDHLEKTLQEGESFLREHGWVDPGSGLPKTKLIEEVFQEYLGTQENPPPREYKMAASLGLNVGTAYEALGRVDHATAWYQLGQYIWRGQKQFESAETEPVGFAHRMTAGTLQIESAICADRIDESLRAKQLFTWAAANRVIAKQERDDFDKTGQRSVVWEWTIERAYALFCLQRWQDAIDAGGDALRWMAKDGLHEEKQPNEMPAMILPTVMALARYELDPSETHEQEAIRALDLQNVETLAHADHLSGLFFLFNLRAKYPEWIERYDTSATRAMQGAQACIQMMWKMGIKLDRSPESLKQLERTLRGMFENAGGDEQRKQIIFLCGCYFGEIVRDELAGGLWNLSSDTMLSWTLDWAIGEFELHLWPFQRVKEYAARETNESLHELWKETEKAYVSLGLEAH